MNECYTCAYRRSIPGDCHSSCAHPDAAPHTIELVKLMSGIPNKLNVTGEPHGIASGWFMWPINFDPVWLTNCDGYTRNIELTPTKEVI